MNNTMHNQHVQPSMSELAGALREDLVGLVNAEKELAKRELSQKANKLKREGAQVAVAGVVTLIGAFGLAASAVLALALVMAAWLAALLVGLFLLVIGGSVLMKVKAAMEDFDPVPQRTVANLKQDARVAQEVSR